MPVLNDTFGSGNLYAVPPGANATPIQFGVLQDVTVDIQREVKPLYGQLAFAVDTALGKGKITGKAKVGQIYGSIYSNIALIGSTNAAGTVVAQYEEAGAIPGTPYAITVANSATWTGDLGVWDTTAGKMLKQVASAPATGQYSIAAGVYTFAAADTTHAVKISYTYTSAATGNTTSLVNPLMGVATQFQLIAYNTYNGRARGVRIWAAVFSKFQMSVKNDDFTMFDLDFEGFADSQGRVIDAYEAF